MSDALSYFSLQFIFLFQIKSLRNTQTHTHSTNVSEVLGKITGFMHAVTCWPTSPQRRGSLWTGLSPDPRGLWLVARRQPQRLSSCLSSFVFFASALVICWQSSSLRLTQVCPVNVSGDPVMTFQLVLPLSSTSHSILPLCLLQPLPVSPFIMLRNPLILSLECLYPLNPLPTTSDRKLHTVSKSTLLWGKKLNKSCRGAQREY